MYIRGYCRPENVRDEIAIQIPVLYTGSNCLKWGLFKQTAASPSQFSKWIVWYDLPWSSQKKLVQKIPSRELTYPPKWHFEDDFPFPKVGYVSSLEGSYSRTMKKSATWNHREWPAPQSLSPVRWGEERWKKVGVPSIGRMERAMEFLPDKLTWHWKITIFF